jgi:selenocysteine-specific translation elongation factor
MNHIISVPLDPGLAEFIGKKGSENGITFYNRKAGDNAIVALAPTSIADRFYAVAESMLLSGQIVVSTANLDRLFGEVVVACSLLDRKVIFTDDNPVEQFLKSARIERFEVSGRETLQEKILEHGHENDGEETRVDIDRAFPVKGLGTVLLGIVTKGTLKVHQELYHSGGKKITVRSIQSQDIDIEEAGTWTRVGIVPKGVEHDEVEKGDLLTSSRPVLKVKKARASIRISSVGPEIMQRGSRYFFVSNFSAAFATVESVDGGSVELGFEKHIPLEAGDEYLLIRVVSPRIFAAGRVL